MRRPGRCGSSGCEFSKPIRKERGSGERKRHRVSRLSPYRRSMEHCRSQTCSREFVLARHRRRGAEMRRALSAKKREEPVVFPRLYSHRPAPAVELSPTDDPTWHRHHAGRRGCGGRRTRPPPPIPYAFRQQIRPASDTITHFTWRRQYTEYQQKKKGKKKEWRRERDSNPRRGFPLAGLANLCFRPLSHLSAECTHNITPVGRNIKSQRGKFLIFSEILSSFAIKASPPAGIPSRSACGRSDPDPVPT